MSKPPQSRSRSATSWTIPKPANVLSYAYLWSHEAARGEEDGRKHRPVVVVIAREEVDGHTELLVVPVTTQPPKHPRDALEIPTRVKSHLGLDATRCWIMVTELNRFRWPGPDIRPIEHGEERTPYYGFIPKPLFDEVLAAVIARAEARQVKMTTRSE